MLYYPFTTSAPALVRFLAWRKLYHRYKLDPDYHHDHDRDEEDEAIPPHHLPHPSLLTATNHAGAATAANQATASTAVRWLLAYVEEQYTTRQELFSCVRKVPGYPEAAAALELCQPGLGWAARAAWLAVTAGSVWQVREVMRVLLAPSSPATGQDVTELLYLLATLLLYFQRQHLLPDRLHFLVYHALYYYEHDWAGKPALPQAPPKAQREGQQSLLTLGFSRAVPAKVPTAEQQRIIQHPLPRKDAAPHSIKIVAFAGTGKTSTLVKLTEAHPNIQFLLVVYNKAVRIQADSQFPKANVSCKTVHQMAMAKAGFMFSKKLCSNLKAQDILESGLLPEDGKSSLYQRAGQVLSTLNSFMNSSNMELEQDSHVPRVWKVGQREEELSHSKRQGVLCDAITVWAAMQDKEDNRIRIPHDGYLKVWQLRRPSLQRVVEHQVLLLDEGQDMNPAMLDIFMHQQTTRVIVGDPNQQIYLFRGAVNALDLVSPTHTYYLTQSFRFGPEIASVANRCLMEFKGRDERTLVGGKKVDSYLGDNVNPKGQTAIICRTNVGVFDRLHHHVVILGQSRVGLVGGVDSYNLEDYLDIYRLMMGKKEHMIKFKKFHTFNHLETFAKNVDDIELLSKIKIVKKYGDRVPGLIEKIRSSVVKDIKSANTVLSTVHKAKGLEFETVVLWSDFPDYQDTWGGLRHVPEDEANLIYVAITRAKRSLVCNQFVKKDLLSSGDLSRVAYYRAEEGTSGELEKCQSCPQDLSSSLETGQLVVRREECGDGGVMEHRIPPAAAGAEAGAGASKAPPELVEMVRSMGFSQSQALEGMARCGDSVERAVDWILRQKVGEAGDSKKVAGDKSQGKNMFLAKGKVKTGLQSKDKKPQDGKGFFHLQGGRQATLNPTRGGGPSADKQKKAASSGILCSKCSAIALPHLG